MQFLEVNMSNQKVYKRGEVLFKDGDKITNVVFIQSGSVSQCLIKGKKNVDLFQIGANQVLGEGILTGATTHQTGAVATTETKTMEIPAEVFKQQYESAPQFLKIIIKSFADRLKQAIQEVRSSKMEKDSSPCPDEFVPRVYGSIFFTARHKGEVSDEKETKGQLIVEWNVMKSYAQRVFGESQKRMEQAINILVKLKLAHWVMGKLPEDPEGPDVIQQAVFHDINVVEAFFEFYQYYFYKPGKGDLLKYEESVSNLVECFLKCAEPFQADRFGVVSIPYTTIQEAVKKDLGLNLNNDHFGRLEQKGVMSKRKNTEKNGVFLEFELKEYKNIFFTWKILREIDKWNEKGYVDMDEKEEKKKKPEGPVCPQCAAAIQPAQKFCGECGAKLDVKAAA
jgi:CRP-like cAMP-binding protein